MSGEFEQGRRVRARFGAGVRQCLAGPGNRRRQHRLGHHRDLGAKGQSGTERPSGPHAGAGLRANAGPGFHQRSPRARRAGTHPLAARAGCHSRARAGRWPLADGHPRPRLAQGTTGGGLGNPPAGHGLPQSPPAGVISRAGGAGAGFGLGDERHGSVAGGTPVSQRADPRQRRRRDRHPLATPDARFGCGRVGRKTVGPNAGVRCRRPAGSRSRDRGTGAGRSVRVDRKDRQPPAARRRPAGRRAHGVPAARILAAGYQERTGAGQHRQGHSPGLLRPGLAPNRFCLRRRPRGGIPGGADSATPARR